MSMLLLRIKEEHYKSNSRTVLYRPDSWVLSPPVPTMSSTSVGTKISYVDIWDTMEARVRMQGRAGTSSSIATCLWDERDLITWSNLTLSFPQCDDTWRTRPSSVWTSIFHRICVGLQCRRLFEPLDYSLGGYLFWKSHLSGGE